MQRRSCFGIPSVFSVTAPHCGACEDNSVCRAAVVEKLRGAPQTQAVMNLLKAIVGVEPETKVETIIRKLKEKGMNLTAALECGVDPFEGKSRTLSAAFQLLRSQPVTKAELTTCFVESLGWAKTSARTEVTTVWQVFVELGLATWDGVRLIPNDKVIYPSKTKQNSVIQGDFQ